MDVAYQQNHSIKTPSAASETVSSPPCTGYIQSQNPLKQTNRRTKRRISKIIRKDYQQYSSIIKQKSYTESKI